MQAPEIDEIVAAFKAEWVKPGSGIADAWVEFRNGQHWLFYQITDIDKMPNVPFEYRGLVTIITLYPAET